MECAIDGEGRSPAEEFVNALASGEWAEAPDHDPPRDEEQIHDWAQLLTKIEFVGRYGQPPSAGAVNHLRNGVWEFKHGAVRLTYWDTPGRGSWSPKTRHQALSERESPVPGADEVPGGGGFWWYPDLDEYLRLGCAWPKTGQKAPQDKIDEAERLREEDTAHDRHV